MAMRLIAAAMAVAVVLVAKTLRIHANEAYTEARAYEDVYYLPPPRWLPVLSLGYRDAVADLLWARTLIYFGEEMKHRGAARHVFGYADAMLALDEHFRAAYRWAATAALYRPTEITAEDGWRSVEYLRRAVELWPDDGELAWELGATLRFELVPMLEGDEEAKAKAKLEGTEHLRTAARLGAGPPWLAVTAAGGLEDAGRTEQAIRHLEEVYQSVTDDFTRHKIEQQLARLRSESHAANLRRAIETFERQRKTDYPYVSAGLFLVLGRRPEHSWADAVARGFREPEQELFRDDDDDSEAPGEDGKAPPDRL